MLEIVGQVVEQRDRQQRVGLADEIVVPTSSE